MIIKNISINILLIGILLVLKCFSIKQNYMYVGKGLYYSTIEDSLQECIDNFAGLQNIQTSIFIKSGTYIPKKTLRSSIFGETSSISFIGEGIDKTIIECQNLNRLISLQMSNSYTDHVWKFKNMTINACNNIETIKVISGNIQFEDVKFTGNKYGDFVSLTGTTNALIINSIFTDNFAGPNIYLSTNGDVKIYNTKLLGFPACFNDNIKCGDNLINLISIDRVHLMINDTLFSNSYHPNSYEDDKFNDYRTSLGAFNFKTIEISDSIFENTYAYNSGALSVSQWEKFDSTLSITNTTFKNNFSEYAAVIRTAGKVVVTIEDSLFYNNTSINKGIIYNAGDLTIEDNIYETYISCNKCYFENPYINDYEENVEGRLITSSGYGDTDIINSVINNFQNGNLFNTEHSKINILNTTFSNMSLNNSLINLLNENEIYEFNGCSFNNITIKHEEYGLIYTKKNSGNLRISNSRFSNIFSYNAAIILSEINFGNNIDFFKNKFENIYSRNGIIVIKNEDIGVEQFNGITIENCEFNNCSSGKSSIISIDYGSFCDIKESTFTNCGYGGQNYNNNLYKNLSGSILKISGNSYVNFENNNVNDCYCAESGGAINLSLNSTLKINNSVIENCKSGKNGGVLYFNNWKGNLNIKQSEFKNNKASNNGGIFNIDGNNVLENANISIDDSKFINNSANLGGIIYIGTVTSNFDVTNNLKITNSHYENNKAKSGEIFFISHADQAKKILDSSDYDFDKVDSHPCDLSWNNSNLVTHMNDTKKIMSGDNIPNGLKAYILSDTNRLYNIIDESTIDSLSNVMFVNATILDKDGNPSNDAIIMGDRETFCWSGVCSLNSVKVYGKTGDYILQIYMISNGGFISMNSKKITVDVTIEECDRTFSKDYLNIGYDICYDPVCSKCVHGKCTDNQNCECDDEWDGISCDKRFKYKYSLALRIIFEIICAISALFSIFLIYGIWANKNESIIKKSNPTFLIITVVGSLINYSTVIFYHGYRTNVLCSTVLWVKFIGFSVLYGSILIRIMRVWKIVSSSKQKFKTSVMNRTKMFTYLFGLILIYIIILVICTLIQKITIDEKYSSNKAFNRCTISKTTISLYGLTIAILIWGVYLALETSNLPEQFNEAKSIGISTYIYAFAMIVTEVIDNITDLNPDYYFLLMIFSMLIYTWTSIFTIVVPKVYSVYSEWFVVFDILKRNVNGTENMVSTGQQISNGNFMDNMDVNKVGGLSVIGK